MKMPVKNIVALMAVFCVAAGTLWMVKRSHKSGHLDVIEAQAMDMSQMRPPTGAAPVKLITIKSGAISNFIDYSGTVEAYNEQDISPRITGTVVSLPVYPGDTVYAGELITLLDSAELTAQAQEANANARAALVNAQVARVTHHQHHAAELEQTEAAFAAAQEGVSDARSQMLASQDAVSDAEAEVQSAQASAGYWTTEISREKTLVDAGAVSQQEYQNELAQNQSSLAAVVAAKAKLSEALAMTAANQAKVMQASREADVAQAAVKMSNADIVIAQEQAEQAGAGADAALAAASEANIVQGYTRITASSDGVVVDRPISPGTLVQPGTVILRIAEIDKVRVQANVAVADLTGVHTGSAITITTEGDNRTIDAQVKAIFPSADPQSRTAIVETIVANPGRHLLPGAFVSMRIATNTSDPNVLLVPTSSIVSEGGQSYVWLAKQSRTDSGQLYECVLCHIHYTAAQAKKFHYVDPMDGGKLVAIAPMAAESGSSPLTAHETPVHIGDSDGTWTEVTSGDLGDGDRVVAFGQAGLTEGCRLISTEWGPNGPTALPAASDVNGNTSVYRCQTCGMTYSAADALKDHYVDPMDGGKLVRVDP